MGSVAHRAFVVSHVGLSALSAAMAINVAERTREIGVMKAIVASDRRIFRILIGEAWPMLATAGSVLACVPPALRAARLPVRAALGEV
jgi:ABC-type lipoprotein release transport system permease subunit